MHRLKHTAAVLCALLLALCLTGCTTFDNFVAAFFPGEETTGEVIKIGVFEPITGSDASDAAEEVKGIELAHELFGTVNGASVELVYGDNQSDVEMARTTASQLVEQEIKIVLGSYKSTLSLAASETFEDASIPAICATCTNPLVTQTNEFYFRVCFIDAYQGISAAKYVTDGLGRSKAVCLKQAGDDYAAAMIEQFQQYMEKVCGEGCVTVIEYPEGTTDFTYYISRVEMAGADCVFFPCTAMTGDTVLSQCTNSSLHWIGCSKWSELAAAEGETLPTVKAYLEGVTYVQDFDLIADNTPMTETFIKAYKEKYGEDQTPSENCALGFDAYLLALEGLRTTSDINDGVLITSALKSVRNFEGATGYISIDSQGDPAKDVVIEKILNSGTEAVYTAVPD